MKKRTSLIALIILLFSYARSQDMGFHTTDIGGEAQWYPHGMIYNLHLAFNAKLNSSFQLRLGYNKSDFQGYTDYTEAGDGWGGGIGYRYYFKPYPYQFFVGARADIWSMKFKWDDIGATGVSKILVLHPAVETGYTFVVNDALYITLFAAGGPQTTLHTGGDRKVVFGRDFKPLVGLSTGIRL